MFSGPNQRSDKTVSYLSQMVMKKGYNMQSIHIAKIGIQLVKPRVVPFRKLHEQQGIKPTVHQPSAEARISSLEAQLGVDTQPKRVMWQRKREGLPKNNPAWVKSRGNPVVTHQASDGKCKKPFRPLGSSTGEENTSCVSQNTSSCTSVQAMHFSAQTSLIVVETKTKLDHKQINVMKMTNV